MKVMLGWNTVLSWQGMQNSESLFITHYSEVEGLRLRISEGECGRVWKLEDSHKDKTEQCAWHVYSREGLFSTWVYLLWSQFQAMCEGNPQLTPRVMTPAAAQPSSAVLSTADSIFRNQFFPTSATNRRRQADPTGTCSCLLVEGFWGGGYFVCVCALWWSNFLIIFKRNRSLSCVCSTSLCLCVFVFVAEFEPV